MPYLEQDNMVMPGYCLLTAKAQVYATTFQQICRHVERHAGVLLNLVLFVPLRVCTGRACGDGPWRIGQHHFNVRKYYQTHQLYTDLAVRLGD